MFGYFKVSGQNFDQIIGRLESMASPNLMPLAGQVGGIMLADNREGLLAGLDADGVPMAELADATIRRGRGGDGTPLNPRGIDSGPISDYQVRIEQIGNGALVIGEWPTLPYMQFHRSGTRHMPARNPVGIRPEGWEKIAVEVADFATALIDDVS